MVGAAAAAPSCQRSSAFEDGLKMPLDLPLRSNRAYLPFSSGPIIPGTQGTQGTTERVKQVNRIRWPERMEMEERDCSWPRWHIGLAGRARKHRHQERILRRPLHMDRPSPPLAPSSCPMATRSHHLRATPSYSRVFPTAMWANLRSNACCTQRHINRSASSV